MNTLIIGDSHGIFLARSLGTVQKGVWDAMLEAPLPVLDEEGGHLADFVLLNPKAKFFGEQAGRRVIAAPFASALTRHNQAESLCLVSLHGNDHNGRFMCRHAVPFDFVCPQVPDQIQLGRQIIPRAVMLRQLGTSGAIVADKLGAIQRLLPHARIVFVLPPPPIPDAAQLLSNPEAFDFERHPIEDKWVRLKIYHAYVEVLAQACHQLSVPVLPPPPKALDAEGFLARPHWQGATHAAPSYYSLLLAQHPLTRTHHAPVQAFA